MACLRVLDPRARALVDDEFRRLGAGQSFAEHVEPFVREVPIASLSLLFGEAQLRFAEGGQVESDAWLAPRLHYALRLTRREAADRRVWDFLGLVAFPGYVRWRFSRDSGRPTKSGPPIERYTGNETKQAIARLWWGAELTRNGDDYSLAEAAFKMQSISNNWQRADAFHSRPLAIAVVQILAKLNHGGLATDDQVNAVARCLTTRLATTVLEATAPVYSEPNDLSLSWFSEPPAVGRYLDELPPGPPTGRVNTRDIAAASRLVELAAQDALGPL